MLLSNHSICYHGCILYTPYLVPVSVKGIVFDRDTVWLRSNERGEWELPGGKIDLGEQPTETVIREIREELGYEVVVKDLISAHMYTIEKSIDESSGVLVLMYMCDIVSRSGIFELNGEAGKAEFKAFQISEINELNMPNFYKEAIARAAAI